tara:strand:+ start:5 stop:1717 length:1713 start_codon:yes stop_codon:yes gene_type:complete
MGKKIGCSGGYGGSQHLVNNNFLSNGIQGGMVPIATGVGYFYKLEKQPYISVSYIGDGTLGEGIIYESMNIASKWELPLLIVMENNQYAQSTSMKQSFSGDLQKRVEGFGLKFFSSNTNDLVDLDQKSEESVTYVRQQIKPAFLVIETLRLNSHSKSDDNRNSEEIKNNWRKDLINQLLEKNSKDFVAYYQKIKSDINKIIKELRNEKTLTDIKKKKFVNINENYKTKPTFLKNDRYNTKINYALVDIMEKNKKSLIIGEDIEDGNQYVSGSYGGAFKVTKNLNKLFPNRIFNTPISEAGIVGISAGYSIKAGRTFVELMFGDFSSLVFDQILQHVTKFEIMYNGKVSCPLIIRTPMGGKRGYGPTHSQSIEKHFIGIPNLLIVVLNHRISPKLILNSIFKLESIPVLIVENKILYTIDTSIKKLEGYRYSFSHQLFPLIKITPSGNNSIATIICYGETLFEVELAVREALIELELFYDILCPTVISPVSTKGIKESVQKTNNLIIVEEGSGEASWGSEVVSRLTEQDIKIDKLLRFSNNHVIPSSYHAEKNILPNKQNIYDLIISIEEK